MKEQNPKRKNVLLWADILLAAVSLVCTAYTLKGIWDDRSFGGFGSLFLLLLLYPYLIALGAALVFLLWFARSGRRWTVAVAVGLETVGPVPWLWLAYAIESPLSWFELLMVACAAAGVLLLISLLTQKRDGTSKH